MGRGRCALAAQGRPQLPFAVPSGNFIWTSEVDHSENRPASGVRNPSPSRFDFYSVTTLDDTWRHVSLVVVAAICMLPRVPVRTNVSRFSLSPCACCWLVTLPSIRVTSLYYVRTCSSSFNLVVLRAGPGSLDPQSMSLLASLPQCHHKAWQSHQSVD